LKTSITGIFAPIITPFSEDETVAYDKLEYNLRKWVEQGLDGIVMPGSNSESVFLRREERLQIWQVCADVLEGTSARFLAGTGMESTAETVELTQVAGEMGAQATLLLPPFFYKSQMTYDVLLTHFRSVADASPIPILVYNVPVFTGLDLALSTLEALAEHPNIIGVKDSSSNVVKMASLQALCPDFLIFSGTGSSLLPFLSLGAVGGILALANFAAVPLRHLMDAFLAGRLEEARAIQLSLTHINSAVTTRFGVPGLKYAMDQTGFCGGIPRRPLLPVSAGIREEIDRLLAGLKLE
jgi:4-hydroxy-2-oxoglutarate aldolase